MGYSPITIMEITKKFDISYQTANYYVNLGFFNVVGTKGNKRIFDEKEIAVKIQKIKTMRAKGYPLRLIREHLK